MTLAILITVNFTILLTSIYLLFRYVKKKLNQEETTKAIREEVDGLILNLNRVTEENIRVIEDRITAMQKIDKECEKKAIILKKTLERGAEIINAIKALDNKELSKERNEEEKEEHKTRIEILKLHEAGANPADIAGKLMIPLSEVEFCVSVYGNGNGIFQ